MGRFSPCILPVIFQEFPQNLLCPTSNPCGFHRHGVLSKWLGVDAGNEPRNLPEGRQFAPRARMRLRLTAPRRTSFQHLAGLLLSARVKWKRMRHSEKLSTKGVAWGRT